MSWGRPVIGRVKNYGVEWLNRNCAAERREVVADQRVLNFYQALLSLQ